MGLIIIDFSKFKEDFSCCVHFEAGRILSISLIFYQKAGSVCL